MSGKAPDTFAVGGTALSPASSRAHSPNGITEDFGKMFTHSSMEDAPVNLWSAPLPTPAEADAKLAEYREQRVPLRAMDPRVLRSRWSRGLTALELERRESPAIEKPIEELSLEELIATQSYEPISESRRSFLTNGFGILSLDQQLAQLENPEPMSIADAIASDDPNGGLAPVVRDAARYGTPYEQIDLITRRQIEWEWAQSQNGNTHILQIDKGETGNIVAHRKSRWTPQALFAKIATTYRQHLLATYGEDALESFDALQARVDLLSEGYRVNSVAHDPDEARAYERWAIDQIMNPPWSAEKIDNTNFEKTEQALLGKRGKIYFLRKTSARRAYQLAAAGAEPVIVVTGVAHRASRRENQNDPLWYWHQMARDPNELDVTGIMDALPRLIRIAA